MHATSVPTRDAQRAPCKGAGAASGGHCPQGGGHPCACTSGPKGPEPIPELCRAPTTTTTTVPTLSGSPSSGEGPLGREAGVQSASKQ